MSGFYSQHALNLAKLYLNNDIDGDDKYAVKLGAISVLFGEWTAHVCDNVFMVAYDRQIATKTGVQFVASVMGILRELGASLPDGYDAWNEYRWRIEAKLLITEACFFAIGSPTCDTIKKVLALFSTTSARDMVLPLYQSCILFLTWKLRCHIVHRGVRDNDPLFVTFKEMGISPNEGGADVLRCRGVQVAWRSQQGPHVYYSFAADQTESETKNNIRRLKLEANAAQSGVYLRLDPGTARVAHYAMQGLGNAFLNYV